jgi:O-antigen ligase
MTVELAGAAGALGLALLLVGPGRSWRLAGLAVWAAGCAALAVRLEPDVPALAWAGGAAAALVLAPAFLRWPWLLPLTALACAPAQVTVTAGGEAARVPAPLYAVVAAAALALAWRLFWEIPKRRSDPDEEPRLRRLLAGRRSDLGPLAWPLGLLVAWLGLGLLWTPDEPEGARLLLFSVLPFGLLAAALARLPWRGAWLATLYGQLALTGLLLAGIAAWEYVSRDVVSSPDAATGEASLPSGWFYPVDAVYEEPAALGRFLAVAILASIVLVLFVRAAVAWPALAAAALTWVGLLPTFSQSSFVALGAGLVVALWARWSRRGAAVVALAALAVAAAALAVPEARDRLVGDPALSAPAEPRPQVVAEGIRIARAHPAAGVGTGGFREAFADRTGVEEVAPQVAPVGIAAENGLPGLALLAWLAVAALALALGGARRRDGSGLARLAVGLALLAILVQSLFTNALFEDPLFWGLLGLAAAAARKPA